MREAHAEARTEASDTANGPALESFPRGATLQDPIEVELLNLARSVLAEELLDPTELRERVLDLIIAEQSFPEAQDEDHEEFVATMRSAFGDDPQFAHQVDQMLIHGARCLGKEQGPH